MRQTQQPRRSAHLSTARRGPAGRGAPPERASHSARVRFHSSSDAARAKERRSQLSGRALDGCAAGRQPRPKRARRRACPQVCGRLARAGHRRGALGRRGGRRSCFWLGRNGGAPGVAATGRHRRDGSPSLGHRAELACGSTRASRGALRQRVRGLRRARAELPLTPQAAAPAWQARHAHETQRAPEGVPQAAADVASEGVVTFLRKLLAPG